MNLYAVYRMVTSPVILSDPNSDFKIIIEFFNVKQLENGTGWSPPRPLLAVPNLTAHPSAASVPITVLLYSGLLLCGVSIRGLHFCKWSLWFQKNENITRHIKNRSVRTAGLKVYPTTEQAGQTVLQCTAALSVVVERRGGVVLGRLNIWCIDSTLNTDTVILSSLGCCADLCPRSPPGGSL